MALTSASTLTDALNQYNDNLSWDGSTAKAILALEAVRWLLANRPQMSSEASGQINFNALDQEYQRLTKYVGSVGSTKRVSFVQGRPMV
jgi:hypothetical protein